METALSGQEEPERWSCWLHPACSSRRVKCEKAPPSLLESPCAATARAVSLPLTSALEVWSPGVPSELLQAVLGTHQGVPRCWQCSLAMPTAWGRAHQGGLHPLHSPAKPLLLLRKTRRRSRNSGGRFLSLHSKLFLKGKSHLTSDSPGFSSAFVLWVQWALRFRRAIGAAHKASQQHKLGLTLGAANTSICRGHKARAEILCVVSIIS